MATDEELTSMRSCGKKSAETNNVRVQSVARSHAADKNSGNIKIVADADSLNNRKRQSHAIHTDL